MLAAVLLLAGSARAEELQAPSFSLGLAVLPNASAPPPAPVRSTGRRFATAAGELAISELLPWIYDRYILNEDYARISWHTLSENWKAGFGFDANEFEGNQNLHPYQGSLFFESGRSNGFTYWESGLFALTGSLIWELGMENERPSINDLVNTTLGGMARGEVQHRLATMLLDNTASGEERFWRELGAAFLNPIGALTRLVNGDLGRDFANPADRFPNAFGYSVDAGYRHISGPVPYPDQGLVAIRALYGDPFKEDVRAPFEVFDGRLELSFHADQTITRFEERGILRSWELTDRAAAVRHVFAFSQEYEYVNNDAEQIGAQAFSAGILSRFDLGCGVAAVTDFEAVAVPLAAVKTTRLPDPQSGRDYDFGAGGGALAAFHVVKAGQELADVGYGVAWLPTVNGTSDFNTLQFFRASASVPVAGPVRLGAGYRWYSRRTSYAGPAPLDPAPRTQSEWRVFVSVVGGNGF